MDARSDRVINPVVPAPPGLSAEEHATWGPRGNRGWIFAAVWLLFLSDTLSSAWDLEPVGRRVAGLALVVAFAAFYLRVFWVARSFRWRGGRDFSPAVRAVAIGAGIAFTVAACLVIGQSGTAFVVYLAVVGVLCLPTLPAALFALALIVVIVVATRAVPGWEPDNTLPFSVFLAALAVWGISQMIARNRQLAEANEEITELAVAQERSRFSRDLHDLLGHSLTVVAVKAELAGRLVHTDPDRAAQEIAEVEQLARTALADVRAAVRGVREISLAVELASARTALEAADIDARLPTALDDIPPERGELFGWVVREGVTNVVRHSGARHCTISVDAREVQIVDDGRGPREGASGGQGLAGLRERAAAAGAALSVARAEAGGFVLRVGW
ncbi:sensor histidine kinase [Spongisporangium articulatum]|uniref:Sensor histidine kinase n=1 Tax=Spongisporangium articulatum TaxID=3362603 RepID=A0ABW8ALC2_9ACTN